MEIIREGFKQLGLLNFGSLVVLVIGLIHQLPKILDSIDQINSKRIKSITDALESDFISEKSKEVYRKELEIEMFKKVHKIRISSLEEIEKILSLVNNSNGGITLRTIKCANYHIQYKDGELKVHVSPVDKFFKNIGGLIWWLFLFVSLLQFLLFLLSDVPANSIEVIQNFLTIIFSFIFGIVFLKMHLEIESAKKIKFYLENKNIESTNLKMQNVNEMRNKKMQNGFIYPIFNLIVQTIKKLNLVEYFKKVSMYCFEIYKKNTLSQDKKIQVANVAIDLYQLFKFGVLFVFWVYAIDNNFSKWLIYYLIYSNLFTYFYYHVWGSSYTQKINKDKNNRRFLNSLLAIMYYILCFAYLYQFHYSEMITWADDKVDWINAIYLSVANAFTLTYGGFAPLTQQIRIIFMSELINTFLFFTIIISNSIPNNLGKEQS